MTTNDQRPTTNGNDHSSPTLIRGIGVGSATALNMIDMIGVGPFITMPLIVSAMGGPQAMLGWILGAVFAMCDGLVWAELGAAMPGSGGSYRYLREIYGSRRLGRLISFLFIWQLSFSAPLSVASGAIGLAGYASYFWPGLELNTLNRIWELHLPLLGTLQMRWLMSSATFVAIGIVMLAVGLLYRKITSIGWMSKLLLAGVLITMGWIIIAGFGHFDAARAFSFPPGAFTLSHNFFLGLGSAMLIATYDYWGYYNVCFLGDEVKDPGKTIPRALLLSILLVGCLYILMNISILGVVPWQEMTHTGQSNRGLYVVSVFMQRIYGNLGGQSGYGPGNVDGICIGFFPAARLFPRSLCRGARWQLFSGIRAGAPAASFSLCLIARAGRSGDDVLLSCPGRCHRRAGSDSYHAAVSGAGDWTDCAAHPTARLAAPVSHVAVSAAGAAGVDRIHICSGFPHQLVATGPLCAGHSHDRHSDLHGAGMAKQGMAVRRRTVGHRGRIS